MDPELIPWKFKNEWIEIYEDAYSGDFQRTTNAVRTFTKWKNFMKGAYRPGMDCTRGLLQAALKDRCLFKDVEHSFEFVDLQLLYSAEIMRFLNLVCDTVVYGKTISLYGKARSLGIPDWVVNVRHQMAHKGSLPPLDILRLAVEFILNWLKVNYWEFEKKEMKEVVLENPQEVITQHFNNLLNVYILLKEQSILGFKLIGHIQDPDIKDFIFDMNSYSLREAKIKCKPWDLKDLPDEEELMNLKKKKYPIIKAILIVIKMTKPFLKYDELYGVNTMDILITKMIDDSVEYNGLRREVWKTLLKTMHSWNKFPLMISYLTDRSIEMTGERSYQAGMWCVELCKALQKRFKVEFLSDFLVKEVTTRNTKKVKEINFEAEELMEFKKLLRKRKLNTFNTNDDKRLTFIFLRVEEMHKDLREVLRLREAIFIDRWEVLKLFDKMASSPTDFTESCLIALYDILKWPFSKEDLNNLIALTKIYKGDGINVSKKKRLYKVENLVNVSINKSITGKHKVNVPYHSHSIHENAHWLFPMSVLLQSVEE